MTIGFFLIGPMFRTTGARPNIHDRSLKPNKHRITWNNIKYLKFQRKCEEVLIHPSNSISYLLDENHYNVRYLQAQ